MRTSALTRAARALGGDPAARAARDQRQRLRAELRSFATPAERTELDAILDRSDPADAAALRRLLG